MASGRARTGLTPPVPSKPRIVPGMLILHWIPINLRVLGCWCGRHLVLQIWVCILQLYNPVSPKWGNLSHHGDTCIDNPTTLSRTARTTHTNQNLHCTRSSVSAPCPKEPRSNHLQSLAKPHPKRSTQPWATVFCWKFNSIESDFIDRTTRGEEKKHHMLSHALAPHLLHQTSKLWKIR